MPVKNVNLGVKDFAVTPYWIGLGWQEENASALLYLDSYFIYKN